MKLYKLCLLSLIVNNVYATPYLTWKELKSNQIFKVPYTLCQHNLGIKCQWNNIEQDPDKENILACLQLVYNSVASGDINLTYLEKYKNYSLETNEFELTCLPENLIPDQKTIITNLNPTTEKEYTIINNILHQLLAPTVYKEDGIAKVEIVDISEFIEYIRSGNTD